MPTSEFPSAPSRTSVSIVDSTMAIDLIQARSTAAGLLHNAVGTDLADGRYDPVNTERPTTEHDDTVMALATVDGEPVAAVVATVNRRRLQLDTIADLRAIERHSEAKPIADGEEAAATVVSAMIKQVTRRFRPPTGPDMMLEIWGRPRQPWHDRLAVRLGFVPHRTLHQMRCSLPLDPHRFPPASTRPLDPQRDTANLVAVNNRAFAYHPDQSDQNPDEIAADFAAEGFDPASVRILDEPTHRRSTTEDRSTARPLADFERRMAGFCWTKIHEQRDSRPAMGEIYVIAVDPDFHGNGLGLPLTAAGLDWLAYQPLAVGMLYVEADNKPAIHTYRKLGFNVHASFTAWRAAVDTALPKNRQSEGGQP